MDNVRKTLLTVCLFFMLVCMGVGISAVVAADTTGTEKGTDIEKPEQLKEIEQQEEKAEELTEQQAPVEAGEIVLPEDNTARLSVKQIEINGNILITDEKIIAKIPLIYNSSDVAIEKADPI